MPTSKGHCWLSLRIRSTGTSSDPEDLEAEWLELNRWVHWLRRTYGLPAAVIPPFWHHHPELLWELSALHLHWLCCYDAGEERVSPAGLASRLRRRHAFVSATGSPRTARASTVTAPPGRPTWPGEAPAPPVEDVVDR